MLGLRCVSRRWAAPRSLILPRATAINSRQGTAVKSLGASLSLAQRRYGSLEAGEHKSGHIDAAPNEGIIFLNSLFPMKWGRWLFSSWSETAGIPKLLNRLHVPITNPSDLVKRVGLENADFQIVEVLSRVKEGGAFVKFSHNGSVTSEDVESKLQKYLKENPITPWWWPLDRMRGALVRGRPWVEDMYRLPTRRVIVEFLPTSPGGPAAELTQEQLYSYFRPYGKLADITPQPADSKILPKFAYIDFFDSKRAVLAKNCLHGYVVEEAEGGGKDGTILKLGYQQKRTASWAWSWATNHPRIVLPILFLVIGTFTAYVFDPIRTFFIKSHVEHTFSLRDNRWYKWLRGQARDILSFRRRNNEDSGMSAIWDDRKQNIEQVQTWLMETADTFIIVQGPRGSGKRELVIDQALRHKRNKLIIDCKPIQEARGDSKTIEAAAKEVGYYPVFSWMNSISGLVDLAAQGAAGVKTGFSETLDSQLSKIWANTATALKQIALEARKKDDKDANMTDDEYLEAHPEKRPVVVIDNFLHKSQDSSIVYDKIADWAAGLTTANIAHVVFLTNDVSFSKSLSKALPDRVFRQISLSDCSPEAAKSYVIKHLDTDPEDLVPGDENDEDGEKNTKRLTPSQRRKDLAELDECIGYIGGRLTDLEFLARRIKTGETPKKAVEQIVEQSASEILKMYLYANGETDKKWTSEQAWTLIKQLATSDTLRFNEVLLSDPYKSGGEAALRALEQAEMIAIISSNGRPTAVKPGKPVYQSAFRALTEDAVLRSKLDLGILSESIKSENATIEKMEAELRVIAELPRQPTELTTRVKWLLGKVQASQMKIEQAEKESAGLKKVLTSEY